MSNKRSFRSFREHVDELLDRPREPNKRGKREHARGEKRHGGPSRCPAEHNEKLFPKWKPDS